MKYTLKAAREVAKVSKDVSKMPGTSFNIDAKRCNVGSKLVKKEGTVCSKCYWLRIQKFRKNVDKASIENYNKTLYFVENNPQEWIKSMVRQISGQEYHRWFGGGDLINEKMLDCIVEVAVQTPDTKHWLPTKEVELIRGYTKTIPDNLVIRVSSPKIDQQPLKNFSHTSIVVKDKSKSVGHHCPSLTQGNICGSCRACWDKSVKNITYTYH